MADEEFVYLKVPANVFQWMKRDTKRTCGVRKNRVYNVKEYIVSKDELQKTDDYFSGLGRRVYEIVHEDEKKPKKYSSEIQLKEKSSSCSSSEED